MKGMPSPPWASLLALFSNASRLLRERFLIRLGAVRDIRKRPQLGQTNSAKSPSLGINSAGSSEIGQVSVVIDRLLQGPISMNGTIELESKCVADDQLKTLNHSSSHLSAASAIWDRA